jgi:hypothetical protein
MGRNEQARNLRILWLMQIGGLIGEDEQLVI